jgi:ribonuclease PH
MDRSSAALDMNAVLMVSDKLVEVQSPAEQEPFSAETLGKLLRMAKKGIDELIVEQKRVLGTDRG